MDRTYNFRNVHRHLSGADTHTQTVDDTTDDQHRNVLGGADNDRSNAPMQPCMVSRERKKSIPASDTYQITEPI